MITIQWDAEQGKFVSTKTGNIIDPVKAGMGVDPDLSDVGWRIALAKLQLKSIPIPFSEMERIVK